jgi:hypothetical protein
VKISRLWEKFAPTQHPALDFYGWTELISRLQKISRLRAPTHAYVLKNSPLKLGPMMITFFCDLCQFSSKKSAFFSKTNVMITFSPKLPFV